jgi:hypothetical protein
LECNRKVSKQPEAIQREGAIVNVRFHSILAVCFAINAPAFAARITVDFTGHVSQVNDWSNVLGGLSLGRRRSGRSRWTSATPCSAAAPRIR